MPSVPPIAKYWIYRERAGRLAPINAKTVFHTIDPQGWIDDIAVRTYGFHRVRSLDQFFVASWSMRPKAAARRKNGARFELYFFNDDPAEGTHWWLMAYDSHEEQKRIDIFDAYSGELSDGGKQRKEELFSIAHDETSMQEILEDALAHNKVFYHLWEGGDSIHCGFRAMCALDAYIETHLEKPTGRSIHVQWAGLLGWRGPTFEEDTETLSLYRRKLLIILDNYYDILSFQECTEQIICLFARAELTDREFRAWRKNHVKIQRAKRESLAARMDVDPDV